MLRMSSDWQSPNPAMKSICRTKSAGFTLLELLLVITVVAILAALILPTIENARKRAKQVACINNLKQIYIAFQLFKHDHNGETPAGVSTNDGGVHEFFFGPRGLHEDWSNSMYRVFQALSNSLVNPKVLICRADNRVPANSFAELSSTNISYYLTSCFLCLCPSGPTEASDMVWAGDRNLIRRDEEFHWTHEMHQWRGNILFGDGHVEQLKDAELAGNRLFGPGLFLVPPAASPTGAASTVAGTSSAAGGGGPPNTQAHTSPRTSASSSSSANSGSGSSAHTGPSGAGSGGGALNRLESFFSGKPGGKVWPSPSNAVVSSGTNIVKMASAPPATASPSVPIPISAPASISTTPQMVSLIAGPPEPIIDKVARTGSRLIYWLLFLLLLIVAAMGLQRRWHKRMRRRASQQDAT